MHSSVGETIERNGSIGQVLVACLEDEGIGPLRVGIHAEDTPQPAAARQIGHAADGETLRPAQVGGRLLLSDAFDFQSKVVHCFSVACYLCPAVGHDGLALCRPKTKVHRVVQFHYDTSVLDDNGHCVSSS